MFRGAYADLVTALGFKPSETSEKRSGGFDSHPLPFSFGQLPLSSVIPTKVGILSSSENASDACIDGNRAVAERHFQNQQV